MNSSNPESGRKRIGVGMYLACWLTRRDPELLTYARTVFRFQVASEAILLLTVAGIALITWAAFFAQFFSAYIVVPLTLLAVTWLIIMDQTLAAAGWEPKGVLRENKKGFKFSIVFFIRLSVGLEAPGDIIDDLTQALRVSQKVA